MELMLKGKGGLLFRPSIPTKTSESRKMLSSGESAYQLDSITTKLWPLLRDGKLTGDGKLLDGSYRYQMSL